jgi:hypothetical protein
MSERERLLAEINEALGPTSEQPMDKRARLLAEIEEGLSPPPLTQELGDAALAGAERGAMNFVSGALGLPEPPKSTVGAIMTGASPNTLLQIARLMYNRSGFLGAGEPRSSEDAVNQAFQESRARNAIERATDVPSSFVSDLTLKVGGVELPIGPAAGAIPEVVAESAPALLSAPLLGGVRAIGAEALGATAGGVGRAVDKQLGNEFPFAELVGGLLTPGVKTIRADRADTKAQRVALNAQQTEAHTGPNRPAGAFAGPSVEAAGDPQSIKDLAARRDAAARNAVEQLSKRAKQAADDAVPRQDRLDANLTARDAANSVMDQLRSAEKQLWDAVDLEMPVEDLTSFKQGRTAILREHRAGAGQLVKGLALPDKNVTFNDLKQHRTALQSKGRAAEIKGDAAVARLYFQLADNTTEAMRRAAGSDDAFENATSFSKALNDRLRDNPRFARLLGASDEDATSLNRSLAGDEVAGVREARRGTEGFPEQRAAVEGAQENLLRHGFQSAGNKQNFLRDREVLQEFEGLRNELQGAADLGKRAGRAERRLTKAVRGDVLSSLVRSNSSVEGAMRGSWAAGRNHWKRQWKVVRRDPAAKAGMEAWTWQKAIDNGLLDQPEKFDEWFKGTNKLQVQDVLSDDQMRFLQRSRVAAKWAKKHGKPGIISNALARVTGATAGATVATTTPGTGLIAASIGSRAARQLNEQRVEDAARKVMDIIMHDPQLLQRALKKDKRLFAAAPIVAAIEDASSEDEE